MDALTNKIRNAKAEADRFRIRADAALHRLAVDNMAHFGCKETAACKRASMDLTRALAELRKP